MKFLSDDICFGYRETSSEEGLRGEPYTINRELIKDCHLHLRGGTGQGKSSLIARLVFQLCQAYDIYRADRSNQKTVVHSGVQDPVFVIINGQDLALFHQVRLAAEATGRTFRYFSLLPERSASIDMFQMLSSRPTAASEMANMFVQAFNLDGGLGHGNLYFTSSNLSALSQVVKQVIRRKRAGEHVTLADLVKYIERNNVRDQQHIRMMLEFLLPFTQLQPGPNEQNTINFRRAIREREVICGIFPPIINAGPARQLAGIMAYGIIHAALEESVAPAKPIIIIDEVQEIAGRSFSRLLEHSRKQMSMVLAHQNTSQLKNGDLDLSEVVSTNTDIKVHFTFAEKEIEQVLDCSQESRDILESTNYDERSGVSRGEREFVGRKLHRNKILDISAMRGKAFIINKMLGRHVEPTPIRMEHPISFELYEQIKEKLPPLIQQPTAQSRPSSTKRQSKQAKAENSERKKVVLVQQDALTALLKRKQISSRPRSTKSDG